jgi:hypothetical protein
VSDGSTSTSVVYGRLQAASCGPGGFERLRGDVFTRDVIETWLDYKRTKEVDAIRLRPHPHEFHLYYDI